MIIEVVFDVETQKLFSDIETEDPADLGVSIVSVYRRIVGEDGKELSGEMKTFWNPEAKKTPIIPDMWTWFEEADRIIGFNSKKFDVPALRRFYSKDFTKLPHFDILEKVKESLGRRISLNALADETLGSTKIDVGTNAVFYWANPTQENLEKLQKYCEADVSITRDLYDYGMLNKQLKYIDTKWNSKAVISVDFSYPPKTISPQMGLF